MVAARDHEEEGEEKDEEVVAERDHEEEVDFGGEEVEEGVTVVAARDHVVPTPEEEATRIRRAQARNHVTE